MIGAGARRWRTHGRHQVDDGSAAQRILDEMRLPSETQDDIALGPQGMNLIGVDKRPISNASGEFNLILSPEAQSVANQRAQTVGADQEIGVILVLDRAASQSN